MRVAEASLTGSLSKKFEVSLNCDKNGCSVNGVRPKTSGWNAKLTGRICALGTCYNHEF